MESLKQLEMIYTIKMKMDRMLLGTLGASLTGNLLTGKGIYISGQGSARAGEGFMRIAERIYRSGQGTTRAGEGCLRAGKLIKKKALMLLYPLTNFEIHSYYKNESRFNGVYSRDNLPKTIKNM